MSGRGFWIVALGTALAALIVLNVLRSGEPEGAGTDVANDPPAEPESGQPPLEAARGAVSAEQRADTTEAEKRNPSPEPQPVPPPTPGRYAAMSAALADRDAPPERRIEVLPMILDTDRAFAAESVDPAWSTAAEAGVLRRIAEIPGASYVSLNVECRTTLCLLQFIESATPAPNSGIADIPKLVEPERLKPLWMFGIRVRGGAPLGIAYLQRVETTETPAGATDASVP